MSRTRSTVLATLLLAGCDRTAPHPHTADAPDLAAPVCTLGRVFDALPPCPERPGDGRIDIAWGCVDDGCVGMTALELEATWNAAPTCERPIAQGPLICSWGEGVSVRFDDLDDHGVPDPDSPAAEVYLEWPYDGTTREGLGPDVRSSCFLRTLGDPDAVSAVDDDAGYTFRFMAWTGDGVSIYDPRGDGIVSMVVLGGAR